MSPAPFFPLQKPFHENHLDVGRGHRLWYAQYGNPDGIALLWLHGGPGSGASPRHQYFADPARYRLVLYDQRGCGRSVPAGATTGNDTQHLVQDIEQLRRHLGLGKILLGGGSWGACLALAYAQRWPLPLHGLVLRAPFLAGRADIDRFFQPDPAAAGDAWRAFACRVPAPDRPHMLRYIAGELAADGPRAVQLAQAWNQYQMQREQIASKADAMPIPAATNPSDVRQLVARYRIQAHYLANHCFLNEAELLQAATALSGLPVAILHGENDAVCDPANSARLHQRIAGSRLRIGIGAGHDPFHPEMATALTEALNCFAGHGHFDHWKNSHAGG